MLVDVRDFSRDAVFPAPIEWLAVEVYDTPVPGLLTRYVYFPAQFQPRDGEDGPGDRDMESSGAWMTASSVSTNTCALPPHHHRTGHLNMVLSGQGYILPPFYV